MGYSKLFVVATAGVAAAAAAGACHHTNWVPGRAVMFSALNGEKSLQEVLLGRQVALSNAPVGAIHEALGMPDNRMLDAVGRVAIYDSQGSPFKTDSEQSGAALGIAGRAAAQCSGAVGVNFHSASNNTAHIDVKHLATLTGKKFTPELADCCRHPSPSCLDWIITTVYETEVTFDATVDRKFGAGLNFSCSKSEDGGGSGSSTGSNGSDSSATAATSSGSAAPGDSSSAGSAADTHGVVAPLPTTKGVTILGSSGFQVG